MCRKRSDAALPNPSSCPAQQEARPGLDGHGVPQERADRIQPSGQHLVLVPGEQVPDHFGHEEDHTFAHE